MALFDPRDFGVDPQGWLSSAFQSLPQMDIAPNEGWPRARNDLAENQRGRDAFLQQQQEAYQARQPVSPFDQPGQSMGFSLPAPGAPQMAPEPPQPPMPPQGPQMPPSAMLTGAMVPPAAAPPMPTARPVPNYIQRVSQQYGLDPSVMARIAQIESGGNPTNVTGSYKGLYQLSNDEFRKWGTGDIFNPVDNANAAARKFAAESAEFEAKYGRKPTATDLYMTHQQGPAGYEAHLTNPDRPAWQNMLSTGEGRERGEKWARAAIWGNVPDQLKRQFGSVDNITSAQFVDMWRNKVEGQGGGGMAAGGPQIERASLGGVGTTPRGWFASGNPQSRAPEPLAIGGVPPAGQPIGIGDRIQAAGAGFFNAGSPMQAIGNLIGGAITGQRQDPTGIAAQIYNQTQQQTAASQDAALSYVMGDDTIPQPMKMTMMQNPALAAEYVKGLLKPSEFDYKDVNGTLFATNKRTPSAVPVAQGGVKPGEVTELRKEVSSFDEVKSYSKAVVPFSSMVKSQAQSIKDPGKSAVDIDFVYGLAKIFDPDSVVREGEMLLVKKLQSLPEEVQGYVQKFMTGNGLTKEVRQRILEIARTRMGELNEAKDRRIAPIKGIAERRGMNWDDIAPGLLDLPDVPPMDTKPAVPTTQVQEGATATNPKTGQKIMFKGGQWVPMQ